VPEKTPSSSLVKVPRVIAMMWSPLMSSQGPSLRCLAPETAKGAADTASVRAAEAQRRTSEAEEFGAALAPAAARRPVCPAGEILPPQRLAAAPAGSSAYRDMQGLGPGTPKEPTAWLMPRTPHRSPGKRRISAL
jgi:hypothetical protein